MSASRVILSLVMALVLLAACGKRGPLYHPGQKAPEQQPEQQQPATPASPAPGY